MTPSEFLRFSAESVERGDYIPVSLMPRGWSKYVYMTLPQDAMYTCRDLVETRVLRLCLAAAIAAEEERYHASVHKTLTAVRCSWGVV